MSYCPNCGRQILDESLGCPVCNVRNNIDPTKKPVPTEQTDEYKEGDSFREEAKAEQAETVDSFTVEEADGKTHHFETNEETGDAEYKKKHRGCGCKNPDCNQGSGYCADCCGWRSGRDCGLRGRRCAEQKPL